MKNLIIKILPVFFVCIGVFTNSCTELEDRNFTDLVASEFQPTASDAGSLMGAAYGSWRNVVCPDDWGQGWWLASEVCSDEIVIPARPYGFEDGGIHRVVHEHTWDVLDGYVNSLWWPCYQGIANTNRVLFQIDNLGLEEADANAIKAELRVLRASYYWMLCDQFGNVAFIDRFDIPEGFIPPRKTRTEIYDFIITEITESLPYLSEANDATTYGRFNSKGAANALLAKIYLNAEVYTGTPQWQACIDACDDIIELNKYSLEAVQKNCFTVNNENSSEIVFAVINEDIYTAESFFLMFQYCLPKESQEIWNIQDQPWGGASAIPQFIDTFDPEDARLNNGFLIGQQFSSSGDSLRSYYGTNEYFNVVNYIPGVDSAETFHGYYLNKYEMDMGGKRSMSTPNDFVIFRYADILMMKAESLLRTGRADEAAALVTEVRMRSFADAQKATVTGAELGMGSSYDYGLRDHRWDETQEGGDDIQYGRMLDELGWEFVGEAHRRTDMIRFGVFHRKSYFSHSANESGIGINEILFPIPLEEMNKNSNLIQNPGY